MHKKRARKQNNKKSKHKHHHNNKKNIDREVYREDGLEMIREGKNVFLRNNRTLEQHEKFIEEVKKNRPLQFENIQKSIDRVIEIYENNDIIKLLGGLAYNEMYNQFNPQDDGLS